jgi:hypothetical protein
VSTTDAAKFVCASPGSLEYIHETDFHLEDPRGALLVDVLEDGRFEVHPLDTLKRARCVVTVDLDTVVVPEALHQTALARCREQRVAEKAILGIRLAGEPPFAKAQLPVLALERRIREALKPVSLDVRFDEDAREVTSSDDATREDDVAATLGQILGERAADSSRELLERLAGFVAPRVGDGGAWRGRDDPGLEDALSVLLDLVAGAQANSVREVLASLPEES